MGLQRVASAGRYTVGATSAASTKITFGSASAGQVHVPSGSALTLLTWYSSPDDLTYNAVQDGAGNAVTSTVSGGISCLIPAACFACEFLKAVDTVNGASTQQITVTLKA